MISCFQIKASDNVAVLLEDGQANMPVTVIGSMQVDTLTLNETVEYGHKVALVDMPQGAPVVKYGIRIGHTTRPIRAGDWVHLHNCASDYDERSSNFDVSTGSATDTVYE